VQQDVQGVHGVVRLHRELRERMQPHVSAVLEGMQQVMLVRPKKARWCARQAMTIVDQLLEGELIVLAPEHGARARLEQRLVRCLTNDVFLDGFAAERLLGVLVRCAAVEEVFADERTAHRALTSMREDLSGSRGRAASQCVPVRVRRKRS
jgi:hypothetical protein